MSVLSVHEAVPTSSARSALGLETAIVEATCRSPCRTLVEMGVPIALARPCSQLLAFVARPLRAKMRVLRQSALVSLGHPSPLIVLFGPPLGQQAGLQC